MDSKPAIRPLDLAHRNRAKQRQHRRHDTGRVQSAPGLSYQLRGLFFGALDNQSGGFRSVCGRAGGSLPDPGRLEIGGSFQHLLEQDRSNLFGFHAIWQPTLIPLDIRAEYANSKRGSGYWIEPAYRLSQLRFLQNEMRRTQLVARYQQFFTGDLVSDALPAIPTKEFESGLSYYFMDGLKATSNYGRQFSSAGNLNVWTLGLTYRFVVPMGSAGGAR